VNTRGDRQRDCPADDRLVCSPYYPHQNGQAIRINERCVDNAVGLEGQRRCRCVRQPEDVLGGPTATTEVSAVQAKSRTISPDRFGKWLRESIADF